MPNLTNRTLEDKVKRPFRERCRQQNARCVYCREPIDYTKPRNHPESFEVAHKYPVKTHPHLAYDPTHFRPSHSRCNRAHGAEVIDETGEWVVADWR